MKLSDLRINHKLDTTYKPDGFKGFEFETPEEIRVEGCGDSCDLFRIDRHNNGEYTCYVASWDEYCVHDEVSDEEIGFDLKELFDHFDALDRANPIDDHTEHFLFREEQ